MRARASLLLCAAVLGAAGASSYGPIHVRTVKAPETAAANYRVAEYRDDAIHAATARLGAVPVTPGQRPPFIPRATIVVRDNVVSTCPLGPALAGQCGAIVAWIR